MSARFREKAALRQQMQMQNSPAPGSPGLNGSSSQQWWNKSFNANNTLLSSPRGNAYSPRVGSMAAPRESPVEISLNGFSFGGMEKEKSPDTFRKPEKKNTGPIRDRPLDPQQVEEMREIFDMFDTEGKELITPEGLQLFFEMLGIVKSIPEWKQIILSNISLPAPEREDGVPSEFGMTFEDFIIFYHNTTKDMSAAQEIKEAFRVLDDNGNGLVEIKKVLLLFDKLGKHSAKAGAKNSHLENSLYRFFRPRAENGTGSMPWGQFWEEYKIDFKQFVRYLEENKGPLI